MQGQDWDLDRGKLSALHQGCRDHQVECTTCGLLAACGFTQALIVSLNLKQQDTNLTLTSSLDVQDHVELAASKDYLKPPN